jgi:cysteinyl-tRNA synthetase
VKLVAPAELVKARDEKRAAAEAKAAKKAAQVAEERRKREAKLEKGRVPPTELFRPPNVEEGKYSTWDEKGIPLTDGDGKELSKNQAKKAEKDWAVQDKLHQEYLKWKAEEKA